MKRNYNEDIYNTDKNISIQDLYNISDLNQITTFEGVISINKDFQTLEIEKALNINQIPNKKPNFKETLEKKDKIFNKEYMDFNSLYTSINCYVKIYNKYDYSKLIVNEKNIIVESIKKVMKLREWSFSDISTKNAKNNSSDNQLPNCIVNDTIDKIVTGRDAEEQINKEKPFYLLNINLDLVTCKLIVHKEKQKFRLLFLGHKKSPNNYINQIKIIKFNCVNSEKTRFYHVCELINKCIILSDGYKSNIFGINCNKNYFTQNYINILNFVKEANSCDILLFKNFSSTSKCQRCITKGDYDHIALLIKSENKLILFDCIDKHGIRIRNFTDLIILTENLSYEKIVYRKLVINIEDMCEYICKKGEENSEFYNNDVVESMSHNEIKNIFYKILNQKLNNFIKNNKNAKYEFSVCKYLCKSKKTPFNQNLKRNSYFCSELVAAVYMFCNIMSKKFDPFNYLPGDFGEKGIIEFINGFSFGPETILDFSE